MCHFIFFKTQYTASVGIQAFVPNRQQTTYPCGIIGNELISVPWECTFTVSESVTHNLSSFPDRGCYTLSYTLNLLLPRKLASGTNKIMFSGQFFENKSSSRAYRLKRCNARFSELSSESFVVAVFHMFQSFFSFLFCFCREANLLASLQWQE